MKQQEYKVGAYLRISRDDENIGESGSITIQRDIIKRYCDEQGLNIVSEYQDDGFSGLNFNRPDFKRMLEDISNGEINCVITKDLSRLGRDYIMTGHYTEVYFTENNVRYIAIGDGYDSLEKNNSNNDFAPFKFIMNDLYAKDLSKKQRASRNAKYLKGEFVAAYAPYGYRKADGNHNLLVPDEETAPIVNLIFDMYANGNGRAEVRNYLQENKVPTPLAIKHLRGERYSEYMETPEHRYEWSLQMISTIVKNPFYLGHTVHLRYRKATHKSKMKKLPKNEHLVVENTHQAIITEEQWQGVRKHFRDATSNKNPNKDNVFKGVAVCADCGKGMNYRVAGKLGTLTKRGKPKKFTEYMSCETYCSHGKVRCSCHYTSLNMLKEIVTQRLNRLIGMVKINENKVRKAILIEKEQNIGNTQSVMQKQLAKNEKRLSEISRIYSKLYEDRALEKITEQNYIMLSTKLSTEQADLETEVELLREKLSETQKSNEDVTNFIEVIKSMEHIEKLDNQLVRTLIDKIEIGEKSTDENGDTFQSIEISYKFIGKLDF